MNSCYIDGLQNIRDGQTPETLLNKGAIQMQIAGTFLEIRPNILDLCVLCYQFVPVPV